MQVTPKKITVISYLPQESRETTYTDIIYRPVTREMLEQLLDVYKRQPMECIAINKEGIMLYQDKKGYEDYWRKHQVSPIAFLSFSPWATWRALRDPLGAML